MPRNQAPDESRLPKVEQHGAPLRFSLSDLLKGEQENCACVQTSQTV